MKHPDHQISFWFAIVISLGSLILVTSCAVGPNYNSPRTEVPPSFANAPTNSALADEETLATWWKGFENPKLNDLVAEAIAHNHDLSIATANVKEARALRGLATFDLAPTVSANAGYAESLSSKAVSLPGAPRSARETELFDSGFDATWEFDLFGRVRRSVEAANADLNAVEDERLDVMVSVTAEVARNYFELRGLQNQLAVAQKNKDVQTETLRITQLRLKGGRGTEFDVSRSSSLLNLTLSTIPPLEGSIQKTIHRLSVLTGQQPTALTTELSSVEPLPSAIPALALSNPEAMLRRRPDIRAAEQSLAAATARIGVATADLFPRVTFIGNIGLQATSFTGLGKNGADTWSFGPRITWAAFDLGRVQASIKAADARMEGSLAFYERTVLIALEETENTLVDFGHEQSRQRFLESSAQASQQAVDLAHQRYEAGASDFLSVLDSERTLLEAQDRLAASQTRTLTALIAVYKALGGGIPIMDAK